MGVTPMLACQSLAHRYVRRCRVICCSRHIISVATDNYRLDDLLDNEITEVNLVNASIEGFDDCISEFFLGLFFSCGRT